MVEDIMGEKKKSAGEAATEAALPACKVNGDPLYF